MILKISNKLIEKHLVFISKKIGGMHRLYVIDVRSLILKVLLSNLGVRCM